MNFPTKTLLKQFVEVLLPGMPGSEPVIKITSKFIDLFWNIARVDMDTLSYLTPIGYLEKDKLLSLVYYRVRQVPQAMSNEKWVMNNEEPRFWLPGGCL